MDLALTIELCKHFEGFRANPYLCPAGIPTIGYGSTYYADGRRVQITDPPISQEAAERLLLLELQRTYLPGVLRLCPGLAARPTALQGVVDFAYNLGLGRLQTSTLRRLINAGDWVGAKAQMMVWVRGGGRVLSGLVQRRTADAALL